jgi:ABC-type transporter Mla MlaB component
MSRMNAEEIAPGSLVVSGDLRVEQATEFFQLLSERLEACASLSVNLLDVEEADVSTVQIMLLLKIEADRSNKALHWLGFATPITELVQRLNLSSELGEPQAAMWE